MFESIDASTIALLIGIGIGYAIREWRYRRKLRKFIDRIKSGDFSNPFIT